MSINSGAIRKAGPFSGNGSQTSFPFTFKVFQASDLYVVLTDPLGVETVQTLTSQYTVSLNSNQDSNPGGSVVMLAAPATNYKLTLASQVPQTQGVVLTNTGGFYPTVINDEFDKLTILIQQLNEQVSRCAKLPISSTADANTLSTNIAVLAANLPVLTTVASNITAITAVNANAANINAVNTNSANINAVAGNIANVNTAAGNMAAIISVNANAANINAAVANAANINAAPAAAVSAANSANAAASSAATAAATAGYSATTSTPLTVPATGAVSLTVQTGKSFSAGIGVYITSGSNSAVSMQGTVTSYNASTGALVVNIASSIGTGTFNDGVIVTAASVSGGGVGYASILKFQ